MRNNLAQSQNQKENIKDFHILIKKENEKILEEKSKKYQFDFMQDKPMNDQIKFMLFEKSKETACCFERTKYELLDLNFNTQNSEYNNQFKEEVFRKINRKMGTQN